VPLLQPGGCIGLRQELAHEHRILFLWLVREEPIAAPSSLREIAYGATAVANILVLINLVRFRRLISTSPFLDVEVKNKRLAQRPTPAVERTDTALSRGPAAHRQ
jgi:hypothetical protein